MCSDEIQNCNPAEVESSFPPRVGSSIDKWARPGVLHGALIILCNSYTHNLNPESACDFREALMNQRGRRATPCSNATLWKEWLHGEPCSVGYYTICLLKTAVHSIVLTKINALHFRPFRPCLTSPLQVLSPKRQYRTFFVSVAVIDLLRSTSIRVP